MHELSMEESIKYGERFLAQNKERIEKVIADGKLLVRPELAENWESKVRNAVKYRSVDDKFGEELDPVIAFEQAVEIMRQLSEKQATAQKIAEFIVEVREKDEDRFVNSELTNILYHYCNESKQIIEAVKNIYSSKQMQ